MNFSVERLELNIRLQFGAQGTKIAQIKVTRNEQVEYMS